MSEPRGYMVSREWFDEAVSVIEEAKQRYKNPAQPQPLPGRHAPPLIQRLSIQDVVPTGTNSAGIYYWLAKVQTYFDPGDDFVVPPLPFRGWRDVDEDALARFGAGATVVVWDDTGSNVFAPGLTLYAMKRGAVKFNTSGNPLSSIYNPLSPVHQVQFESFSALPGGDWFLRVTGDNVNGLYPARPQLTDATFAFADACPLDTAWLIQKAGVPLTNGAVYSATPLRKTYPGNDLKLWGVWCTAERPC